MNLQRFSGKVVLIPEVAANYGALLADAFAEAGASLVLGSALSPELSEQTAENAGTRGANVLSHSWQADSEERAAVLVRKGIEEFGRIDVVVSNLAFPPSGTNIQDVAFDQWKRALDNDLWGTLRLCKAALPSMIEQQKGRIVLVIGGSGFDGGDISGSTTQMGIIGAVRGLARSYGKYNITANCVAVEGVIDPDERTTPIAGQPSGALPRNGLPEELAFFVLALADEANGYVTGQYHVVNGGRVFL